MDHGLKKDLKYWIAALDSPPPMPPPPPGFYRELTPGKQIRAICNACGFILVGDVSGGHIEREREHHEHCANGSALSAQP